MSIVRNGQVIIYQKEGSLVKPFHAFFQKIFPWAREGAPLLPSLPASNKPRFLEREMPFLKRGWLASSLSLALARRYDVG